MAAKIKGRLTKLSADIDAADQRTADAKTKFIEASARLEAADRVVGGIERRIKLLSKDLSDTTSRAEEMDSQLLVVVNDSAEVAQKRMELDENETSGYERIQGLEEEVKKAGMLLEEKQIQFTEAERRNAVVVREIEVLSTKADSNEKRAEVLESTISSATERTRELEEREGEYSLKEQGNSDEIILMEGQFKEGEVRAEAATRSCQVLERNIAETKLEIDQWTAKIKEVEDEISAMGDLSDYDDDE